MLRQRACCSLKRATSKHPLRRVPQNALASSKAIARLQASPWKLHCRQQASLFHTHTPARASAVSADEIMDNLNDLYATAKDEFEIAAEGTEENTVYAAEDREAAREALTLLKETFDKAVAESTPEIAKEVSSRVGQRIRELENAVTAMEERAMEE